MLTIVMYHYVRDLVHSDYPRIKGLSTSLFEGQLDYINQHYTVIDIREVARAVSENVELPKNACILTFDDGLIDHYETVFPMLIERSITGSFYPSVTPITAHRIADVHKLHFILASEPEEATIKNQLFKELDIHRQSWKIKSNEELFGEWGKPSRFDNADAMFVKNICQFALPEELREIIINNLFRHYVSSDEKGFAENLYMNKTMLNEMISHGMTIGGHGYSHRWLSSLSKEEQEKEVKLTYQFLRDIYEVDNLEWVMSYPSGKYNKHTIELSKENQCVLGLTVNVELADINKPYELGRLDTNDLPKSKKADLSIWTQKIKPE